MIQGVSIWTNYKKTKMASAAASEQDWIPVTIRSSRPKVAETVSKAITGSGQQRNDAAHARRLAESEYEKPKRLAPESRVALVQGRIALKKNQTEMNAACNFPPNTIREIEAGRLCPSTQQLNTLNRILKTGLRLV